MYIALVIINLGIKKYNTTSKKYSRILPSSPTLPVHFLRTQNRVPGFEPCITMAKSARKSAVCVGSLYGGHRQGAHANAKSTKIYKENHIEWTRVPAAEISL